MAKKAGGERSTTLLGEALAQLVEHYQTQDLAEQKLLQAMTIADEKRKLRFEFDGPRARKGDPTRADVVKRVLGRGKGSALQLWPAPKLDLAGSAIEYQLRGQRCTIYRIRLPREYVERLLPLKPKPKPAPQPGPPPEPAPNKPGRPGAKPSPIWDDIFEHFDKVCRAKRFPSQGSVAEAVLRWLDDRNKSLDKRTIERGIQKHRRWWWD